MKPVALLRLLTIDYRAVMIVDHSTLSLVKSFMFVLLAAVSTFGRVINFPQWVKYRRRCVGCGHALAC